MLQTTRDRPLPDPQVTSPWIIQHTRKLRNSYLQPAVTTDFLVLLKRILGHKQNTLHDCYPHCSCSPYTIPCLILPSTIYLLYTNRQTAYEASKFLCWWCDVTSAATLDKCTPDTSCRVSDTAKADTQLYGRQSRRVTCLYRNSSPHD